MKIDKFSILIVAIILLIPSCKKKKAIFLIPNNYRGKVVLIYDSQTDEPISKRGNKFIYIIPDSGILKVNEEYSSSFIEYEYFYVDKGLNQLQQLNSINSKNITEKQFGVFREGMVVHVKNDSFTGYYEYFIIDSFSNVEKYKF